MSKPWDNEPTPLANEFEVEEYSPRIRRYIDADIARNLERRMRAAERLLDETIVGCEAGRCSDFDWIKWCNKAKAHSDAAWKEEKQK